MTILQRQITHMVYMLFPEPEKQDSYYNKKYEEDPQRK
jgi:hypothetical protein